MTNNPPIFAEWIEAKRQEQEAQQRRKGLEDAMIEALDIQPFEGTKNIDANGFKVKIIGRMNRNSPARISEPSWSVGTVLRFA